MNQFKWPLNVDNFTFRDKLKIGKFVLGSNRLTQGDKVKELEARFEGFSGSYSIFVSSGSTANTILAQFIKDTNKSRKDTIVFPALTWQTSCSPWIREGFTPKFIDINLNDLSINLNSLEEYLKENSHKVAVVFVTSLLGFVPDIKRLLEIEKKYNVRVMMDNCENTLSFYKGESIHSYFTSTTSTYFGHQIQSVEGGIIFTKSEEEYKYFLMARNHGMTRSLEQYGMNAHKFRNYDVHPQFDFALLSNNFRNTEINAFYGLLDMDRALEYQFNRRDLYTRFQIGMSPKKWIVPNIVSIDKTHVPFALPIIIHPDSNIEIHEIETVLNNEGIETRPLISGNLLRQTAYKKWCNDPYEFPVAEYLHNNAIYVGLHNKLKVGDIFKLVNILNEN